MNPMTKLRVAASAAALLTALSVTPATAAPSIEDSPSPSAAPVRIMPLGDSITQGDSIGGYRLDLGAKLRAAGRSIDFVGSMTNGPASMPDRNHEGHPGFTIAQVHANVVNWLRTYTPRTILLHIGTNDMYGSDPAGAPRRLSALIDRITTQSPNADLFVSTIIPIRFADQTVRNYNAAITPIVRAKAQAGKRVHLVDMYPSVPISDLPDGIHPNAAGYSKMATTWYNAVRSVPGSTDEVRPAANFTNPVLWQDFADIDILRVDNAYYYSASTMHYSPGAPILRSYDLVNWEFAGHSVPKLDFGAKYDLNGGRGYVRGIWASFLNYRKSNKNFYWGGCIDFGKTHIYTATAVDGQWSRHTTINKCYYDAGMLVDDNDTMYVAYGNSNISVAQLSPDGKSEVRSQQVFTTPSNIGTLEGARFYKRNGNYYIFLTRPANGQYILKSTNGPFGPYTVQQVLLNMPGPIAGGGVPHQGGLVQTQNGDWYYMAFVDSYPGGRVPVLAPITWTADGWPRIQTVNNGWGTSYPMPTLPPPPRAVKPMTGTDTFSGTTLGPQWEWNHNPDTGRFSVNNGLRLQTATVTNDLYSARNTLTHRIQGPTSTGTVTLDLASIRDGDRTGLAMLRDASAWIGVKRDGGRNRVVVVNNLTMDGNWNTTGTGTEVASANLTATKIWLRANADIRPGSGRQARFSYSTDGVTFSPLGPAFTLKNDWRFFMGYRFGIFNHATTSLGGAVTVQRFDLTTP